MKQSMKQYMKQFILLFFLLGSLTAAAQNFGDFPKIKKELLLRDIELLYQGLDKYHTGTYWYTSKEELDRSFAEVKAQITRDMNALEFHKLMTPLVGLSREDHTDIYLPEEIQQQIKKQALYFPLSIVFLGEKLYCVKNGSNVQEEIEGRQIISINGETPSAIVDKIGSLFASDGFIKRVKFKDLEGLSFARYLYYYYGNLPTYEVQFEDELVNFKALSTDAIRENLIKRNKRIAQSDPKKEWLEFEIINDSVAYLGLHSFSNSKISENKINNKLKPFLEKSFEQIDRKQIKFLVIDVSKNGGGNEGSEGLVFSYLDDNYQKYSKVRAKAQRAVLDNGIDKPIKLSTFGFFERWLANTKMPDGSYERKNNIGFGLMAYNKAAKFKFDGTLFVIISPVTYSASSEFANMLCTNDRAVFVGQETGGGYYGNTSGYSSELKLPHSGISVDLPALQFIMNVKDNMPFGRGVIPKHEVIPTFEQYVNGDNEALDFILELIK